MVLKPKLINLTLVVGTSWHWRPKTLILNSISYKAPEFGVTSTPYNRDGISCQIEVERQARFIWWQINGILLNKSVIKHLTYIMLRKNLYFLKGNQTTHPEKIVALMSLSFLTSNMGMTKPTWLVWCGNEVSGNSESSWNRASCCFLSMCLVPGPWVGSGKTEMN